MSGKEPAAAPNAYGIRKRRMPLLYPQKHFRLLDAEAVHEVNFGTRKWQTIFRAYRKGTGDHRKTALCSLRRRIDQALQKTSQTGSALYLHRPDGPGRKHGSNGSPRPHRSNGKHRPNGSPRPDGSYRKHRPGRNGSGGGISVRLFRAGFSREFRDAAGFRPERRVCGNGSLPCGKKRKLSSE